MCLAVLGDELKPEPETGNTVQAAPTPVASAVDQVEGKPIADNATVRSCISVISSRPMLVFGCQDKPIFLKL